MISRLRLKWQFLVLLYSVFSILDIALVFGVVLVLVVVVLVLVASCSCCVSAISPILRRLFCAIVFPSSSYMRSRKDTMSPTYVYRCIYISGVLSSYATGTDAKSGCTHTRTHTVREFMYVDLNRNHKSTHKFDYNFF